MVVQLNILFFSVGGRLHFGMNFEWNSRNSNALYNDAISCERWHSTGFLCFVSILILRKHYIFGFEIWYTRRVVVFNREFAYSGLSFPLFVRFSFSPMKLSNLKLVTNVGHDCLSLYLSSFLSFKIFCHRPL